MLSPKSFIEKTLPQLKVGISNVVNKITESWKATFPVNKVKEDLSALQLDVVEY